MSFRLALLRGSLLPEAAVLPKQHDFSILALPDLLDKKKGAQRAPFKLSPVLLALSKAYKYIIPN